MALARASQAQSKPDSDMLASEQVTYRPGPDDPNTVTWGGYKFQANVPKTVSKPELIEKAKANRHFKVGTFDPQVDAYKDEPMGTPKTSLQYRAHAVAWLKAVKSVEEMCERWANEYRLQQACEIGSDDYRYLSTLFQPKLDELILKEDEPRKKRAELVARNELQGLELQVQGVGSA